MSERKSLVVLGEPGWARDAVCTLLRLADDFVVAKACGSVDDVVSLVPAPAVVLFDARSRQPQNITVARRLTAALPSSALLCLHLGSAPRLVEALLEAGARGCLSPHSTTDELFEALRAAARGERVAPSSGAAQSSVYARSKVRLSPREVEVLQLLAQGLTSKEIAARLEVAVSTVDTYRKQLMTKLDLHTAAALARFAFRVGIAHLD